MVAVPQGVDLCELGGEAEGVGGNQGSPRRERELGGEVPGEGERAITIAGHADTPEFLKIH